MRTVKLRSMAALAATIAASLWFGSSTTAMDKVPPAVLIRMDEGNQPVVVPIYRPPVPVEVKGEGLLVWTRDGREQWLVVPPPAEASDSADALAMTSRFGAVSRGENAAAGDGLAMTTIQLAQLRSWARFKGGGFLTPAHGGWHLNRPITIRRLPDDGEPKFSATTLALSRGSQVLVQFPAKEGQAKIAWSEIPDLPNDLKEGLPPGEYTLRDTSGGKSATFTVADAELQAWIIERPEQLARLLGTKEHPLYLQVTVEHLLGQVDEGGQPEPYTADALDLLETAPEGVLTPYLKRTRADLLAHLSGKKLPGDAPHSDEPTGIGPIDEARQLIAEGKWNAALEQLDLPEAGSNPRAEALATLYRAVILSESGRTTEAATRTLFLAAIAALGDGAADAYRARNNYGNFLRRRAQDRLYSHAFEIAAGVRNPLIRALMSWRESLTQYEAALTLAEELGPEQEAAVRVNMAQLYSLLADVVRTLDYPVSGQRRFAAGEKACAEKAGQLASAVVGSKSGEVDEVTQAVGHEILAHLAFRQDGGQACQRHAGQALEGYRQAGLLAGMEGVRRLRGLCALRGKDFLPAGADPKESRQTALREFLISNLLSELLRERIPADQVGLSRAGFFARRTYVNQRIVELQLAEGNYVEALRYAELAKARALQDVLATRGREADDRAAGPRGLSEILADWPEDVAAIEYFLGTKQAWIFVISPSAEVTAYALVDDQGEPLPSRKLVAQVRQVLSGIDHQARKMRPRLLGGLGFDHAWQDELHTLYRELLPGPAMEPLRKAGTVLVVPQHILHYLPFAALVVEPDPQQRKAMEMVMPKKFLLDEPFDICYAPTLTTWDLLRQQAPRPITQVNAMGIVEFLGAPPLPGVKKDLENLQAVFGDRIGSLVPGAEAGESTAKSLLKRRGLLFVGTHGQNVADQPLSSYLLFHPDSSNDGLLTAEEVYSGSAASDLIVMSACYSGLADRSPLPGDDLFGLRRALLHSGAHTVVSGMWDVYDGTGPELMRRFFEALAAGKPAPAALAESQRAFLAEQRADGAVNPWLHPYFWAVYTVAGDHRTSFEATGE